MAYPTAEPLNAFAQGYDLAEGMRQKQAQRTAGNALAMGDTQGGVNALYQAGDLDGGNALAQQQHQQHAQEVADRLKFMGAAADALSQVPPEARQAAFEQHILPTFQAMGLDPQTLDALRSEDKSDAALSMFKTQVAHQLQIVNRGNGGYDVVNMTTGANVRSVPGRAEPKMYGDYLYVPNDQSGAAPGAAATPAATGRLDPQSFFKNFVLPHEGGLNPSDMNGAPSKYGINQKANPGVNVAQLTPDQASQIFANKYYAQSGAANLPPALAAVHADTYFINPSKAQQFLQASGGDPQKYMALREQWLGQLSQTPNGQKYAQAWANRNRDLRAYVAGQAGSAQAQPSDAPQVPGYTLLGRAKAAKPGEDTTVDPNIVKGLLEGRIAPPTQKAAATPYWQAQLQAAASQDPSFDMVNFQARQKTRNDFTSGKSADNIKALNTVMGHLDDLDKSIDGLGNFGAELGPLSRVNNMAAHAIATASGTDARFKRFETSKVAVANELTRVFRGTGGAEADIQAWQKQLDSASNPQALHAVVQQMADLINSRISALGEQYRQGMGTTAQPLRLLTPDKQKAFDRMMGGPSAAAAPSRSAPAAPASGVRMIRYDAQGNRIG